MTWGRALAVLALAALFLYFKWPSASTVVGNTWVLPEEGRLEYEGVDYRAEWGPEVVYEGSARLFERAKYKLAPFFTHHTALSTGDFADSDLVSIVHNGGGNFIWTAAEKPEGTLVVLHMIPLDADVLDQLEEIDDGEPVRLVGRHESDSRIDGPDGMYVRLNHGNHKYLLVESAIPLPD
jgi:hypothetical protein